MPTRPLARPRIALTLESSFGMQARPQRRRTLRQLVIAAAVTLALAAAPAEQLVGRVVRVADGDTSTVLDAHNVQHKIRRCGIDAPEKAQAFGNVSREHLAQLVAGKSVTAETGKTDRYGRSVGVVHSDGMDVIPLLRARTKSGGPRQSTRRPRMLREPHGADFGAIVRPLRHGIGAANNTRSARVTRNQDLNS